MTPLPPGGDPCGQVAVLVLGMHRSGTSALARFIGQVGAALPREPNPASDDNPEGYWEPAAVVSLNDRLLQAVGSSWIDLRPLDLQNRDAAAREDFEAQLSAAIRYNFADASRFVLKDPRICRMVPLYRDLLRRAGTETRVVLVLRAPGEVARSLAVRNQISPAYAGLLWASHLIEAERSTRDLPRLVIAFDDALRDWRSTAERLRGLLGVAEAAADEAELAASLRPELRHHVGADAVGFDPDVAAALDALHAALLGLCGDDTTAAHRRIDAAAEAVHGLVAAMRDVLAAEFCFQRLTSAYDTATPLDPMVERQAFVAAMQAAQAASRLAAPALVAQRAAAGTEKVGVFLAGVQKAGTTSLFGYLAAHPLLAAPRAKETHFFDDESQDWQAPDYRLLDAGFGATTPGAIRFDATPIYSFWPPAMARIRRYNPAARLILLLRDPIERAYSHWAMEFRRGAETLPFAEAIREGRRRLPAAAPQAPAWREFSYVERGFYATQVQRALALFPARQLLCLDAEALHRNPAIGLERIAGFLGLPAFPPLPTQRENAAPPGPGPAAADVALLRTAFLPEVRALARLGGLRLDHWLTLRPD